MENHQSRNENFLETNGMVYDKMLEGVVKEGTAKAGVYNGALAGKTGTTSLPNDDNGARICGSLAIRQI